MRFLKIMIIALSVIALSLVFLGASLSFAPPSAAQFANTQSLLNAANAYVGCKTNFTSSFAGLVIGKVPSLNSTLNPQLSTLQQDQAQLQSYTNLTTYRNYVQTAYDPELATIRQSILTGVRGSNLSSSTINSIRSRYTTLRIGYESCSLNALKAYANVRAAAYTSLLSYYQQNANNMSSKGFDTSSLTLITNNASSQIVQPYENAITQATTSNAVFAAIRQYCLFNGCKNGTNYHLAARFDVQKLSIIVARMKSNANFTNASSTLNQAQSNINSITSLLGTVGTASYTASQQQQLITTFNQTVALLKGVLHGR